MACPCCNPPQCCPAFRAFDGSNTFYRYMTYYDWDIPTAGLNQYTLTPEDQDFAVVDFNGTPAAPGRLVDGHVVHDAAARCVGYSTDTLPGELRFREPGPYGNGIGVNPLGWPPRFDEKGNIENTYAGHRSVPCRPWRWKDILNRGLGFYNDGNTIEKYSAATGDIASMDPAGYFPVEQKQYRRSLIRYELSGEYPSPPSPYCYLNPNPCP